MLRDKIIEIFVNVDDFCKEFERANPITLSIEVAKKPAPSMPAGAFTIFISLMNNYIMD